MNMMISTIISTWHTAGGLSWLINAAAASKQGWTVLGSRPTLKLAKANRSARLAERTVNFVPCLVRGAT